MVSGYPVCAFDKAVEIMIIIIIIPVEKTFSEKKIYERRTKTTEFTLSLKNKPGLSHYFIAIIILCTMYDTVKNKKNI